VICDLVKKERAVAAQRPTMLDEVEEAEGKKVGMQGGEAMAVFRLAPVAISR